MFSDRGPFAHFEEKNLIERVFLLASKTGLDKLCTTQNHIRSNYFSDTYRAEFRVGGEMGEWDIIHISLPFTPLKEKEFMVRFGASQDQMPHYYKMLGRCIKNDIGVAGFLAECEVRSVIRYVTYAIEHKETGTGSDIYLVSKPMDMFVDSLHWHGGNSASVNDVLSFAARMLQISKGMREVQAQFGVLDMDNVYMMPDGDKMMVTLGGFLYGTQDTKDYITPPDFLPAHCHHSLKEGGRPTAATDIYSITSLTWTLLDGQHYTTEPDLSRPPKYAPEQLVPILASALKCADNEGKDGELPVEDVLRMINKGLRGTMKAISTGAMANTTFTIAEPAYDLSKAYQMLRETQAKTPGPILTPEPTAEPEAVPDHEPDPESEPPFDEEPPEDTETIAEEDRAADEVEDIEDEDDREEYQTSGELPASSPPGKSLEELEDEAADGMIFEEEVVDDDTVIIEEEPPAEAVKPPKKKGGLFHRKDKHAQKDNESPEEPEESVGDIPTQPEAEIPQGPSTEPMDNIPQFESAEAAPEPMENISEHTESEPVDETPESAEVKPVKEQMEPPMEAPATHAATILSAKERKEKKLAEKRAKKAKLQAEKTTKKQAKLKPEAKPVRTEPSPAADVKQEGSKPAAGMEAKPAKKRNKGKNPFIPLFFILLAVLVAAVAIYVYVYPELIEPALKQHFVNAYLQDLYDAGASVRQMSTVIVD